jgi:hypothetical protein
MAAVMRTGLSPAIQTFVQKALSLYSPRIPGTAVEHGNLLSARGLGSVKFKNCHDPSVGIYRPLDDVA